ncbi:DUF1707 domain-containing protein [Actinomycetospora sp. TBRC 11914]|uniref:DUF1707 SHOCT-like domain-containing protein n=1 Tax=Actinomycetospora sp. TBRC 11914 TaxID=2729387 RepID=UPI00145EF72F|nr:DUF1707 domain-containing protein [Actinomycetospora sp. TBRC 11914]NMO89507.1 DUF1707 domain-containing protein [Actinomycetospora sp. TBRC 11914]
MDAERRGVRASDRERALVIARLTRALEHGRLSLAEYDERVAATYSAISREELAELIDDLPGRLW